jgi:hypothetical protein
MGIKDYKNYCEDANYFAPSGDKGITSMTDQKGNDNISGPNRKLAA